MAVEAKNDKDNSKKTLGCYQSKLCGNKNIYNFKE